MTITNIEQALYDKIYEVSEYMNDFSKTVVNDKSIDRQFLSVCSIINNSVTELDTDSLIAELDIMMTAASENKAIIERLNTWTDADTLGVNYCSDISLFYLFIS